MALEAGSRVGDYTVVGLIGAGGMGRVYKVRNIISNREEAMKILLPDLTSERDLAVRFMMEIRTLATLEHPNIAQLRTAFQFENQLVMIMEFVEGVTLEKLATESPLSVDAVLDYSTQVLSALSFAHARGVIHRDIKPANVMITPHGVAKLMDFGIAKNADEMHLTRPGMTIGSVYYMSPEQVRGGTIDARSDLYSFGILLYELLTGRKPFQADTSYSVLNAQLNEAPIPPIEVNPRLSPEMNAIVLHALAKSPDERFQTAQAFHDALKAIREPQMQPAGPMAGMSGAAMGFTPVVSGPGVAGQAGGSAASAGFQPVSFAPVAASIPGGGAAGAKPGPVYAADVFGKKTPPGVASVQKAKSHRGLWIGMGALVAVLALVAIAVVLPHVYAIWAKQRAGGSSGDATTAPDAAATPTPTPQVSTSAIDASAAANPAATQTPAGISEQQSVTPGAGQAEKPVAGGQVGASPHRPPYAGGASSGGTGSAGKAASGGQIASGVGGVAPAPVVSAAPSGPSAQEIREVKDRLMNLQARSDAARSGVQSIRGQQQAQGMDIRGDVLATMGRMNSDLREAQSALAQGDLKAAQEYMDHADHETASLEKFLGR